MMALCQFNKGQCRDCHRPLMKGQERECRGPQRQIPQPALPSCPHLGAPTGEVELIQCQTCRGNVRQKFVVSTCALFGECLPAYYGSQSTRHKCHGCKRVADSP